MHFAHKKNEQKVAVVRTNPFFKNPPHAVHTLVRYCNVLKTFGFVKSLELPEVSKIGFCVPSPLSTLLENLTNDTIEEFHVTKFSTISFYLFDETFLHLKSFAIASKTVQQNLPSFF